jgi:hypothetical protein
MPPSLPLRAKGEAAHHLYERFGFALTEQHAGGEWGATVVHQQFERLK